MSVSRILITGKNKDFPKTVRMPYGVGPYGADLTRLVQIRSDQCVCKRCGGWGEIRQSTINPSERDTCTRCPDCDGEGIAKVAA